MEDIRRDKKKGFLQRIKESLSEGICFPLNLPRRNRFGKRLILLPVRI